ncbi:hypothetical protein EVAR_54695_1 [Eumeta japonica]|uniref:Uncharacterized protein n=1 Tax=Eumeta variegata TaxID=151549 RepID=A0A4C1X966_EUMVA|nr:hypothetical protein EVAR_54695_1 [Eumeta japonica]
MPEWKGRVPLTRSHCERITAGTRASKPTPLDLPDARRSLKLKKSPVLSGPVLFYDGAGIIGRINPDRRSAPPLPAAGRRGKIHCPELRAPGARPPGDHPRPTNFASLQLFTNVPAARRVGTARCKPRFDRARVKYDFVTVASARPEFFPKLSQLYLRIVRRCSDAEVDSFTVCTSPIVMNEHAAAAAERYPGARARRARSTTSLLQNINLSYGRNKIPFLL